MQFQPNDLIICRQHPEWGTWRVLPLSEGAIAVGDMYEIQGDSGARVLYFDEADKHWHRVPYGQRGRIPAPAAL